MKAAFAIEIHLFDFLQIKILTTIQSNLINQARNKKNELVYTQYYSLDALFLRCSFSLARSTSDTSQNKMLRFYDMTKFIFGRFE